MSDEQQEQSNPVGKLMVELQKTNETMAELKAQLNQGNQISQENLAKMKQYLGAITTQFNEHEENTIKAAAVGYNEFAKNISGAVKQLDAGLALNESDRNLLANAESKIKRFNRLFLFLGSIAALSLLGLGATLFGANKWYKTSVQSKEEIKQEIFEEEKARGLVYIDQKELDALKGERLIVQKWVKDNPNDSKPFLNFRNGVVQGDATFPVFKSMDSKKPR